MIISKKKFNEKVREALDQAERERWMYERIERVERECNERIERIVRNMIELESKVALLTDEKKHPKGGK